LSEAKGCYFIRVAIDLINPKSTSPRIIATAKESPRTPKV